MPSPQKQPDGSIKMVSPPCDANCGSYYASQAWKKAGVNPLSIRSLFDNGFQQEAIWAREAAPELFDNGHEQVAVWAREAAPEFISDSNGQSFWTRDTDRFNTRGLVAEDDYLGRRWEDVNAALEARSAAFAEREYLERRWADVSAALEAVLNERGLDFDGTSDPGVW